MANDLKVTKTDSPPQALQKLLLAHKGSLQKALARHMDPERLIRIAVNAMHRTPTLQNCSIQSICNSVVLSGVLGLEPNTPLGHAYLIPYGKECTFQPGYRGMMHLAIRSGCVKRFTPALVFAGDEFEQELGMVEKFRHVPKMESDEWIGAYSFARTPDGEATWVYMPKARILQVRDRFSIAYKQKPDSSPWTTSEDEMAIKTAIKRHFKRLDITIEVARAADVDDQADQKGKQESIIEVEFQELAKDAEEANITTQGSREKQESVMEEKVSAARKANTVAPTEEEMRAAQDAAIAAEAAAEARRLVGAPQQKRSMNFGGK